MDTLQAGFQTVPVKFPLTPYQKAVTARKAVADLVQQQMQAVSSSKVPSGPSKKKCAACAGVHFVTIGVQQEHPSFIQTCSSAAS